MKRSPVLKQSPVLMTGFCLAVAAAGVLLLMKLPPSADTSAKTGAPASSVPPVAGATDTLAPKVLTEDSVVPLPSVSVRGEIITAHHATVPESVWHEAAPAQPAYAVPAPSYPPFPNDPPTPGVPIIHSALRPPDAASPPGPEK